MKVSDNYRLKEVGEEFVIVPIGQTAVDLLAIMSLNDSGADLFRLLEQGKQQSDLVAYLLETYEVDEKTASADVEAFIADLVEQGILLDA